MQFKNGQSIGIHVSRSPGPSARCHVGYLLLARGSRVATTRRDWTDSMRRGLRCADHSSKVYKCPIVALNLHRVSWSQAVRPILDTTTAAGVIGKLDSEIAPQNAKYIGIQNGESFAKCKNAHGSRHVIAYPRQCP